MNAQFREALESNAAEFGFQGFETTQVYFNGEFKGSADAVSQLNEGDSPSLVEALPAGSVRETLQQRLAKLVKQHNIMLFMKGNPDNPQCGFSSKFIALLNKYVGTVIPSFGYFDIYLDEEVRQGMKTFSNWPTFPQLYVNGQFIGGLDVCTELDEEGELEDALTATST